MNLTSCPVIWKNYYIYLLNGINMMHNDAITLRKFECCIPTTNTVLLTFWNSNHLKWANHLQICNATDMFTNMWKRVAMIRYWYQMLSRYIKIITMLFFTHCTTKTELTDKDNAETMPTNRNVQRHANNYKHEQIPSFVTSHLSQGRINVHV